MSTTQGRRPRKFDMGVRYSKTNCATGSPAGSPRITGYANNGNRRDIRFTDTGLGLFTRNSPSQPISGNGVFIGEDGKVGIGTNDPNSILDVDGFIHANRFEILHAGGCSYLGRVNENTFIRNSAAGAIYLLTGTTIGDGSTRLSVLNDGNVGVGIQSPSFLLHVNGNAAKPGGGSWSNSSDIRLKKNIEPLGKSLDQVLKLRGVTFEYINSDAINEMSGERIGVIAQEVENVFPDWVDERNDGYKAVTFRGFEALTVEALRELSEEKIPRLRHWRPRTTRHYRKSLNCAVKSNR